MYGYPSFNATVQEELALQALIRGLQPVRLWEHLCLYALSTWEAALIEAEPAEHVLGAKNNISSVRPRVYRANVNSDEDEVMRQASIPPSQRQ